MRRLILLMAAMAATVLVVSGVAYALAVQCDGPGDKDPDPGQCAGTNDDDEIDGTAQADIIRAKGASDQVVAGEGEDELSGGFLADQLFGEQGNDTYVAGGGSDFLSELAGPLISSGNDVMNGGEGPDRIEGGEGNDILRGQGGEESCCQSAFNVQMFGDRGNDRIFGGPGEDGLEGAEGSDVMNGGTGTDYIDAVVRESVDTPDTVDGGDGFDTCDVNENDSVLNCERITTEPNPTPP